MSKIKQNEVENFKYEAHKRKKPLIIHNDIIRKFLENKFTRTITQLLSCGIHSKEGANEIGSIQII